MTDKLTFRELVGVRSDIPSDAKACANCAHGRVEMNKHVMRKVVECHALPKFPVAVPGSAGVGVQFVWPVMELRDECGLFDGVPEKA